MRVAIISNRVTMDYRANQKKILDLALESIRKGAELILFPEAAATGLVNSGDASADLMVAEPVPGPRNDEWSKFATENNVYFAAGLLERDDTYIFDSAVLYNPDGDLVLHYRRNDPGWHMPTDNPHVYREGTEIPTAETDFGEVSFLICGDLWNDDVFLKLKRRNPDWLLYPFARGFDITHDIESVWNAELVCYRDRWRESGATVLAANSFCEDPRHASVGGAWYTDRTGRLLASSLILQESVLLVDM